MLTRICLLVWVAAVLSGCIMPMGGDLPIIVSQTIVPENLQSAPETWVSEHEDGGLLIEWNGSLEDGQHWYIFMTTVDLLGEYAQAKEGGEWLTDANSFVFSPEQSYDVFAWSVAKVIPSGFDSEGLILTMLSAEGDGDTIDWYFDKKDQ